MSEIIEEKYKVLEYCKSHRIKLMEFSVNKLEARKLVWWSASLNSKNGLVDVNLVQELYEQMLKNDGQSLLFGIPIKVRGQLYD